MISAGSGRRTRRVLFVVPLVFFGVFFAYPVVTILGRGLWPGGSVDLSPIGDVLNDTGLRGVAWFTLWQAAVSTALTLVLALPLTYVLARFRFRGRSLMRAGVTIPFVLPTVVVGSAFLALGFHASLATMLLAHVFFNVAVVVRGVGGLWSHLDPRQEEMARMLGASRRRAFTSVTLPALGPSIAAAASIVFLFCFTSFGVILILAGQTRATLETEIFRQTAEIGNFRTAAALSVLQLLAVVALLVVTARLQRRQARPLTLRPADEVARPPRTFGERVFVITTLSGSVAFLGAPLVMLVARSFVSGNGNSGNGIGLSSYRALGDLRANSVLFVPPTAAIVNSILYGLAATVIALVVGGMAAFAVARSRRGAVLATTLAVPLGVSAVTVGFGLLIALDEPPLDLRTSWILVPIAHALIAIPFVVRIAAPVIGSIDPGLREIAAMLGAGPRRVWREVDLPVVSRALLVSGGFAFAISLGEFGATAFLGISRPDRPTLPLAIYRLLNQPGAPSFGAAMAASTVLMVLTASAVLAIEHVRVGELGSF